MWGRLLVCCKAETKRILHLIFVPKTNDAICNGNRTEWSPIRSVIIRVINKIGRPRSVRPICLIKSMISIGNRTEWSPIRSVIIRVINKITRESDLFNHEYDYRPNWATRSSVTN